MQLKNVFNKHTTTIFLSILIVSSGVLTTSILVQRGHSATNTTSFTNYELAGNPFQGASVGVTCPNTSMTCQNTEAEPAIRADASGNFYGSSENVYCVIGGYCGGTWAYKSTDNGNHFTTLPLPNSASTGSCVNDIVNNVCPGISPAGGDTDLAVAPVKNTNGFYNVYVSSLASKPPLANIYVSSSHDGGQTWLLNPTGASVPVDDREWAAADGANKVCISYHAYGTTDNIVVNCSYDGGITFAQTSNAFDAADVAYFAGYNNILGNLAIDSHNHLIYQTFSSIDNNAIELANCNISCHDHVVWIAVSIDGGLTFKDYPVYKNPNTNVDYGHQFINVSVDKAGNVYVVYDDNHNMYYSFSTNFGQSFTGPFQVNKSPSNTAIYPWSSAGNAGQLDIVWYGTSYYDGTTVPDNYPMSASWYVYYAQNLNALVPGSQFTQVQASGVIHHGGICESGVTCSGNRDLLDDFGIATSPVSGKAVIIYTSDQYLNTALEPATSRSSSSFCTTSDTTPCSHTDIAVQTSGPTVTTKGHRAEISSEDFEELDTSNDGGHSPQNEIDITNVDTNNINRIDIAINGLPLIATWNSPTPILPGQTVQGTSTSVPIGLNLIVGNVYQITVTATFSDGTTETQTINAIYSLDPSLGL